MSNNENLRPASDIHRWGNGYRWTVNTSR